MKKLLTRKRLSMIFCGVGIGLMGVDLFMTRDLFTHIAELMAASILCLLIGLVLDPSERRDRGKKSLTSSEAADRPRP